MNINLSEKEISELFDYTVGIRRRLHMYPEIGFDLPLTERLICDELDAMGLAHTDSYGKHSVVLEIGKGDHTLAFRADMDALPICENTGLEYSSRISGAMHACGHDMHTAVLLGVIKYLSQNEDRLNKRIRFIFQPAEETSISGAKMLVENRVMDGVDEIMATHCDNTVDVGKIGLCSGDFMAACVPLTLTFYGKSAHATTPESGIDAIAMAVEFYDRLKEAVAIEAADRRYIWSVGKIQGGTAHNIISDLCSMDISFRFYDYALCKVVERLVRDISSEIAGKYGGSVSVQFEMSTGAVTNDQSIVKRLEAILCEKGIEAQGVKSRMASEDFGWYLTKCPGVLFHFGTRNEAEGCVSKLHSVDFKADENGMKSALLTFIYYALAQGG